MLGRNYGYRIGMGLNCYRIHISGDKIQGLGPGTHILHIRVYNTYVAHIYTEPTTIERTKLLFIIVPSTGRCRYSLKHECDCPELRSRVASCIYDQCRKISPPTRRLGDWNGACRKYSCSDGKLNSYSKDILGSSFSSA